MKDTGKHAWTPLAGARILARSARSRLATPAGRRGGRPGRGRRRAAAALLSARVLVLAVSITASLTMPIVAGTASASASTGPSISTDRSDYPPGATVTITGAGWQPGEAVALSVNDSVGNTWSWSDNVTADANGALTDSLQLPNSFVANYAATATGAVSGTATTTFTDSSLNILGSDGQQHQTQGNQQSLPSVPVGGTLSLACPAGLTVQANGFGSGSWSLGYVAGYGSDGTLSAITTLAPPGTGTSFTGNLAQCVSLSIPTGTLGLGSYTGELQAKVGSSTGNYFFQFTVTARATSVLVSCTPSSLSTGSATTCTATVTDTDPGTKSWPQGTITWNNNGGGSAAGHFSATTCTLAQQGTQPASQCAVTYTPATGGGQTILGSYAPSDGVHASGGAGQTISVSSTQNTTTTVTSSKNPSTYGGSVTFTATISPSPSGAGTVAFTDGATTLCNAAPVSGNSATCTTSSLSASGSPHLVTASYSGATGFTASTGTVSQAVNKASPVCTVTGYTTTYDTNSHSATGSCTGVNNEALSGLDLSGTKHANAGAYSDTWTFTDATGNYANASGTVTDTINPASPSCTVTGYAVSYDGSAHSATGSCTGVNNEALSGLDLSGTSHTGAGAYSDTWTFTDSAGNYSNATGSVSDTIAKADATCKVTGYTVRYDGSAHSATGSCTGVNNEALSGLDLSGTSHTSAGTYSDTWTFTDATGNYRGATGSITDAIGKADATCKVTSYSVTYDGSAHAATGSCTGVNGEDLTSGLDLTGTKHTHAGTYSDTWTFTDPTGGDYANTSGTVSDTIDPAAAVCSVTGYTVTYDGSGHTATGSCTGAGGADLSSGLDLSGTGHTHAGSYTDSWTFTDPTGGDYANTGGTVSDTIDPAAAVCSVAPYSVTYDGSAHTATGSCLGVDGTALAGLDLSGTSHTGAGTYTGDSWTFTDATGNYTGAGGTVTDKIGKASANCQVTPYDVTFDGSSHTAAGSCAGVDGKALSGLALSGTTHTDAGTYSGDSWVFTDSTGNYANDSGTVTDKIGKASPVCSVDPYTVTFDGSAHTATGSCTGVDGKALDGLDLSGTTRIHAGSYTDPWTFTDSTGNYANDSGTVTDKIGKASANCQVTPYDVTFDGSAHTATGSCTGVDGKALDGLDLSGTTRIHAGSYTDPWTFTDSTGDYANDSGTVTDKIGKATPACSVTGYTATFDGSAHSATGSCTGVDGKALDGLDVSGTTHTNAGTYGSDSWAFTDSTGDYANAGGTVTDAIGKASPACTISGYTATYDGKLHSATGSCLGVDGAALSGLDLTSTAHSKAGTFADTWTFTDITGNYKDATGTVTDAIGKADANCQISTYSVTYDGNSHIATGSCTGIDGEDLTSGLHLSGTAHTNAGTFSDTWTFTDLTGNYKDTSGTVTDAITKADATCKVYAYSVTYDGSSHAATGTCTGVGGEDLTSGLHLSGTAHTNAGTFSDTWTFTDLTGNYKDTSGTVTDTVAKAGAVCSVAPYSVTYDGSAHTATGSCTGLDGKALTGLDLSGTTHTSAGTYGTDSWTFTDGTGNYNNASGTVSDTIGKASPVCSVAPYSVTYDGAAHSAAGSCLGVTGGTLFVLDLSGTSHTGAGTYTDPWTFTDTTGNYNNASGTVTDNIAKAAPACSVTGYTVTYDGGAHTATGSCPGVDGKALTGLDLSGTSHTGAGTYTDPWTFTDTTGNYNNASGTVADKIAKAGTTTSVSCSPATVTLNGKTTCTVVVTGVGPSGTVTWGNGAAPGGFGAGTCPLVSGQGGTASCSVTYSPAAVGSQTITANYGGDPNNGASAGGAGLSVQYNWGGLLAPLNTDPTVVNLGNAGRVYPIKWQLTDANGSYVTDAVSGTTIDVAKVACSNLNGDATDSIDYASSAGGTALRYDSTANQYVYNWATPSTKNTCYRMTITTPDKQQHTALFQLK